MQPAPGGVPFFRITQLINTPRNRMVHKSKRLRFDRNRAIAWGAELSQYKNRYEWKKMNDTIKNYAIFVDSSADLVPSLMDDGKLQMVAMSYTNGSENCELAETASDSLMKEFYDGQRKGNLTRTSQVSPQQFIDAFSPVLQSGRDILYISLSGGLTNTKDSFHLANQILTSDFPGSKIIEVNSLSATGGIGLLAEEAIANREAGMSLEENAEKIREIRHDICHVFMVEDLMYLKRGGRIPAASAIVGSVLSIKPILVITPNGKLEVVDKKRGHKAAIKDVLGRFSRSRNTEKHRVSIVHADAPEIAAQVADEVHALDPKAEVSTGMLSPIIGAHTGPGMFAVIFFGNRDEIMS